MQSIILNSGIGRRMGEITKNTHKSLLPLSGNKLILTEQIESLISEGLTDIIITTGEYHEEIKLAVSARNYKAKFTYIKNRKYNNTNYIYSMYLLRDLIDDDLVLLHGDLVFDRSLFHEFINSDLKNTVLTSKDDYIPDKDFKAVIRDNIIKGIGIDYRKDCRACQPIYKLSKKSIQMWLSKIEDYIDEGKYNVYAEEALNEIIGEIVLKPYFYEKFCMEIDTQDEYYRAKSIMANI